MGLIVGCNLVFDCFVGGDCRVDWTGCFRVGSALGGLEWKGMGTQRFELIADLFPVRRSVGQLSQCHLRQVSVLGQWSPVRP